MPVYPVYAIHMLEVGLDAGDLGLLFIIWSGSAMLFEIPTGMLADRYSRKRLLVLGSVLKAAGFGVWLMAPHFTGFASGFVLWALGSALFSGTAEAYVHDLLRQQGRLPAFERVYGRGSAWEQAGITLALVLGGFIAQWSVAACIVLSVLVCALAAALAQTGFAEIPADRTDAPDGARFLHTLTDGVRRSFRSATAAIVVAAIALLALTPEALEEFIGPLLQATGSFSLGLIGLLYGGLALPGILGATLADRWSRAGLASLIRGYACIGALLVPFAWLTPWLLVLGLMLLFFLHGLLSVLLQGYLQRAIDDTGRATVSSLASFAQSFMALPFYAGFGAIAVRFDFAGAFTMAGMITFALSMLLLVAAVRSGRT